MLIKPDAIEKRISGLILDRLDHLGLQMTGAKVVSLTEELARAHYKNLEGKPFLEEVIQYMMGEFNNVPNHKIYAFVFQGENASPKCARKSAARTRKKPPRGRFAAASGGLSVM